MTMRLSGIFKIALVMTVVLAVLCVAGGETTLAQCAMCRAGINGGPNGAAFAKNFNFAILVLLAPPVTIFCSIFIVAYKHRKSQHETTAEEEFDDEQS
ncbi:MAG TPA: hypothetical protein VGO91_09675 [Pyrinomonadaceae bacterium]|jgi:hypothetical protein|nr:hypothetical protein [Pyrinomonadaceae bacterium]